MPKLTCQCGHTIELTHAERRRLASLACPQCGATRKLRPIGGRWKTPAIAVLATAGVFAIAIAAISMLRDERTPTGTPKNAAGAAIAAAPGLGDPHLAAVRRWLKENTNSGQWEEVRWWPARQRVEGNVPGLMARLKYREQHGLVGPVLRDYTFVFGSSAVIEDAFRSSNEDWEP